MEEDLDELMHEMEYRAEDEFEFQIQMDEMFIWGDY